MTDHIPFPDIASETTFEIGRRLDPETLRQAVDIRDWLVDEARTIGAPELIIGLAERLNRVGVPVDRLTTAIEALHAEYAGVGRIWVKGQGLTSRTYPHGLDGEAVYANSPFAHVHLTRSWLVLDVPGAADDLFGIVPELKALGITHYICVPLLFANGNENGLTFATLSPAGFSERDIDVLRFVMPSVAIILEVRALNKHLNDVLRMYVGEDPHAAILKGNVLRGQVSTIRSAILFADMRDYTAQTSNMAPAEIVQLLNRLFDCLVPAIEAAGGEVLKYLGDGLLAIFRDDATEGDRAQVALEAAVAVLAAVEKANRGPGVTPLSVGIALHYGEAAYGNVGSGARLDFTVVGRDVNLASRVADLNRPLDAPLLVTSAFAERLSKPVQAVGAHRLKGFSSPQTIYRPTYL